MFLRHLQVADMLIIRFSSLEVTTNFKYMWVMWVTVTSGMPFDVHRRSADEY